MAPPAAPVRPSLPTSPTTEFPYQLVAKVGEGAMGEVYRAEDIELGRPVALKVLKPSYLASLPRAFAEEALQRFLQEARAAAAFSHPGVVAVYRVGTAQHRPYIAMEWVEGRTLEEVLLMRERLALAAAVHLTLRVLDVLDAAHRAGIVHRDIKPANLMLTREGRVKVTDFGIARHRDARLVQTQVGMVMGTPHYAAPEQLAGGDVDGRADLYAVGAMLYELLTGVPPHDAATTTELFVKVQQDDPAPASQRVAQIPAAMDAVLARALARRPSQRFASAREMARALQAFGPAAPPDPLRAPTPAPTAPRPPLVRAAGRTPTALLMQLAVRWGSVAVAPQRLGALLDRLLERPLHTAAFCGVAEVERVWIVVAEGALLAAFDPVSGDTGDAALASLPAEVSATLHPQPPDLDPRALSLMASSLTPQAGRLSGLDAAYLDAWQLVQRLEREGFDGVVRLQRADALGLCLFSRGRRVLDVLGDGWPDDPAVAPWESWIAGADATLSVEARRLDLPAAAYRLLLRDVVLDVARAAPEASGVRSDQRALDAALQLHPRPSRHLPERMADSTTAQIIAAAPALDDARWLLTEMAPQFEQHRRSRAWKALLDAVPPVVAVRLHPQAPAADRNAWRFDAVTEADDGRCLHALQRVARGDAETVRRFLAEVRAAKASGGPTQTLVGAVLFAPRFDDDGLAAYLEALEAPSGGRVRAMLALWSHREGYLVAGRDGCHVLLVETHEGRRRPMMPER